MKNVKTTKKRFICVLSVAALSATMLTVPAYSEDPPPADGDTIRVEGESYNKEDGKWKAEPDITNTAAPGGGLNLNKKMTEFDESNKPYVSYSFNIEKTGIYDLEYVANYLKDEKNDKMWLSPFSVTLNDKDKITFADDTPNNSAMTAYTQLSGDRSDYGKYNVPVYLEAGENTIKFTVEGSRYNGKFEDYVFYLDYFRFTYNEEATNSAIIQVESEELIAGNVPVGNIKKLEYSEATDQTYYRFTAGMGKSDGYLEYAIASPAEGEFRLELAGSNTDSQPGIKGYMGNYSVVINGDEDGKISVGSEDGQSSGVTSDSSDFYQFDNEGIFYDKMHSNNLVTLKKGLNKVKVLLDKAAENGNHVIDLDYLKFTPASEIIPTPPPEDDGVIRVEGENYDTTDQGKWTFNTPDDGQVGKSDKLGDPAHTGMVLNSKSGDTYSAEHKPSATYTFDVDEAGIYDLEYVVNYLKDEANDYMYLSPFSVTLNDYKISFGGDTPNNPEMISYKAPTKGAALFGTYKLPVYLDQGENKITFTVEDKRYKGGNGYEFYLDYFELTYDEDATVSDTIQVEAEDLIAGNVSGTSGIAKMTVDDGNTAYKEAAELASNQTMYQFNNGNNTGGYLEYIVPSATEGDFKLEITGSNTDETTGLKSWCGDFNVVINDDTTISVGEDVTPDPKADVYDIMTANQTVKLKQGLNKIKVELDEPDNTGRYLIHLDYLKFTPAQEIIPTTPPVEKIEVSDFIVDSFGVASASITNDGDAPVTVAVISVSYNADKTLASVKLTQKTIGSNVTETVKTDALENATSDTRAYVWNMNGNKPLNEAITPATE